MRTIVGSSDFERLRVGDIINDTMIGHRLNTGISTGIYNVNLGEIIIQRKNMNIQAIEELIQGKVSSLRTELDNAIEAKKQEIEEKKKEVEAFITNGEAKLKIDCQDFIDALEFWKSSTTTTTQAPQSTTITTGGTGTLASTTTTGTTTSPENNTQAGEG